MDTQKSNRIIYFYIYFVAQLIFIYVHSYLPIYFYNYLSVDKAELAFVQIISYSALFAKPLISIYFDRDEMRLRRMRELMILSATGIFVSFLLIFLSLEVLLLFGILLGINFAFTSVIDVTVDKVLVETSRTEKEKSRNTLFLQIGSVLGAIIVPGFYLIVPSWEIFFLAGIILVAPLIFLVYFYSEPISKEKIGSQNREEKEESYSLRNIALMCLFAFFLYADKLYEWPLEPFLTNLIGEDRFSILLIGLILINAIGIVIAGLISHRFDKKKLLLVNTGLVGILLLLTPFVNIVFFLIFYIIIQIMAGFLIVNLISLMIDVSHKKVIIFQIIASAIALAKLVLVPLGTYLSDFLATEWIIFIAGLVFLIAIVPLLAIKKNLNT